MARGLAQGLPRSRRIRKRRDFLRIQGDGRRVTTRNFVLVISAGAAPDAAPRLGLVASRKVGGAVVRNRAKRLLREAFRTATGLFPPGIDVVVIVRSGGASADAVRALDLAAVTAELGAVRSLLHRRAAEALAHRT